MKNYRIQNMQLSGKTVACFIGYLFFETATYKRFFCTTVISSSYNAVLQNHIIPAVKDRISLKATIFLQDEAPTHISPTFQHKFFLKLLVKKILQAEK